VTVTFPTGKVQRFKAVTSPDCEMFSQIALAELGFEAEAGTQGTLTAASASSGRRRSSDGADAAEE